MDTLIHLFHRATLLCIGLFAFAGGISDAIAITYDGLPDIRLLPGANTSVDVAAGFSGGDDSYASSSSNGGIATVTATGSPVTVTAISSGTATITVTGTDTTLSESVDGTFQVTVNTAPVFTTTQANVPNLLKGGASMTEEQFIDIGINTGSLVDTNLLGSLVITDSDAGASTLGIAITGYSGNGAWNYWNGSIWVAVPSLGSNQVLLLGPNDKVRYVGDMENGEGTATDPDTQPAKLRYRLWDGTDGAQHQTVTVTQASTGGSSAFSTGIRESSVPVDPVQDPAELVIVNTTVAGVDTAPFAPFGGVEVNDVDRNPSDTIAVTITVNPKTQGFLGQSGSPVVSFTQTGADTGVYIASGAEDDVEAALQLLEFLPVANIAPVGDVTSTVLQISVSDGEPNAAEDDSGTVTVDVTSMNDVPVIFPPGATTAFVFTRASILAFDGFDIDDFDIVSGGGRQDVTLTVTEIPSTLADGSWVKADGTESAADVLTFSSSSIETAVAELRNLRYVATSISLPTPENVVLRVAVTDSEGGAAIPVDVTVTVATPKVTSNIKGTVSGQGIPDNSEKRLFESVIITGTNVARVEVKGVVATGSFSGNVLDNTSHPAVGAFFETGGGANRFSREGNNMVFVGAASDATNAIRRLAFRPTSDLLSGNADVQFSITLKDGPSDGDANLGVDSQTTAIIVPVNDLPTFSKFKLVDPINDAETADPFPLVEIGDVDEQGAQSLKVDIHVISSLPLGTVADPIPGTLTGGFTLVMSGHYSMTGTPTAVTTAIQALTFTPTPNRLEPGRNETVTFRVIIDDAPAKAGNDLVVRDQVNVLVVSENDPPVVASAPSGQREIVVSGGSILPFDPAELTGFDLTDADLNEEVTVSIRLDDSAKGFLSSTLITETLSGSGFYRGTGTPMEILNALSALEFVLNPAFPVPAGSVGIEVFFDVTIVDRLGLNTQFSFSLLLRVEQATRVVTNTDDSGAGSLRQALEDAGSNDHIAFDLNFTVEPTATIRLLSPLIIDKNLTIAGPGTEKLFISGDSDDDGEPDVQIFQIGKLATDLDPAVASYLHLSYVTLTHGSDVASNFGDGGGAVAVGVGSTLILDHAEVLDCFAEQWGGAIEVERGRIEVSNSLFARNHTGSGIGRGGGAICLFANRGASFVNVTFSENQQGGSNGLGGGALFLENVTPEQPVTVLISHCTFYRNSDASGKGSAIRTNVFNLNAELQNCLLADGDSNPLDPRGAGRILSLGGNVADDDTEVSISQGGAPRSIILLDQGTDLTSQTLDLEPLADHGGQTRVHALPAVSPARDFALGGTGVAIDQRDVIRGVSPDSGAFEADLFKRIIINEIQFDPGAGDAAYIEIVNPRDSQTHDLLGLQLWVQGVQRHTFTTVSLAPGTGMLVKGSTGSIAPAPPGGLPVQTTSGELDLGTQGGIVEIRTASGDVVAAASYLVQFKASGAPGVELRNSNEPVARVCDFLGAFLPGPGTPGEDGSNVPLLEGNAPPIAFDDEVDTDEDTDLEIDVLGNDFDADRTDVIRVESLATASTLGAALTIVNTPTTGAAVTYDPTVASAEARIQSLPVGATADDTFDYVILDYLNGVTPYTDRVRNPPIDVLPDEQDEAAANLARATGTVTVHLTGVNDAPTPADDSPVAVGSKSVTDASLVTVEDQVLSIFADGLLANDTDPDNGESGELGADDDLPALPFADRAVVGSDGLLRICWVKPYDFLLGDKDPTRVELSDLMTTSELGASVELVIRADRTQSTVNYDPRDSEVLNALAEGETAIDRFSYLVIDPHGAPGIATVCIQVTGVNDVPIASDDGPFATNEDQVLTIPRIDVLANDTDVDQDANSPNDSLIVSSVEASGVTALGATIELTPAGLVYDPTSAPLLQELSKKEVVEDSFEYTVSDGPPPADGQRLSDTGLIVVRVTGVNDTPTANDDTYSGAQSAQEDNPVSIASDVGVLLNDTDIDMNDTDPDDVLRALPAEVITTAQGAMVMLYADGSFDYDPGILFQGLAQGQTIADSFDYIATDDSLVFANGDAFRVVAGETDVFLPVLLNDVNLSPETGAGLVVTDAFVGDQGGVAVPALDGAGVLYSPAFGFVGVETFTYQIADGPNGYCLADVRVEVVPASGPLTGKNDRFQVAPGGTTDLDLTANDLSLPFAVPLILLNVSDPDQGGTVSIVFSGGKTIARYSPAAGFSGGIETFSYTASAGGGTEIGASVEVVVPDRSGDLRPQHDAFYIVADTADNTLPLLANDGVLPANAGGWIIDASQLGTPSEGGTVAVAADGLSVVYSPAPGFTGPPNETFTYMVKDAYGGTGGPATVTVAVIAEGFRAADDTFAVNWDSENNTFPVLANDVLIPDDGETIEITYVSVPDHGTAAWNASRSAIVYTPAAGYSGPDSFTYEIGAATHPRRAATVNVNVVDRSGELASGDDFYCVAGDSGRNALRVLINDALAPLGTPLLEVTGFSNLINGSVELAPGGAFFYYTPPQGFIGDASFDYSFSDGRGGTGSASVSVKVGSIFVGDDYFTVLSGSIDNFLDVLVNDRRVPGGSPATVTLLGSPAGVSLNASGDAFFYTPPSGFLGILNFAYQVENDTAENFQGNVTVRVVEEGSDRNGAVVTIDVQGANDAPTLSGVTPIDFQRDDRSSKPFASVIIREVDGGGQVDGNGEIIANGTELLTVTVLIDDPAKGTLGYDPAPPATGGFTETSAGSGIYQFIGNADEANIAINSLCFIPTDGRIEWSKHETTTLTICVSDLIAPDVKSSLTTIEVYNIGQLFGDNWVFGNGCTLSWDERRNLTVGGGNPFGFPLGGGGTWSDPDTGQWLVYSDGVSAWNAQTGAKLTGADGTLGGSSSDSVNIPAMIVPKPGGDPRVNLYIFAFGSGNKNIHFTEIDLSVGADGAVVGTAGQEIVNTAPSQQGWVILPQANSIDYWLIIGNGNAYPVTAAGVGSPVTNFNLDGSGASFRYSPDRRRIAVGWSSPKMYLYDFDPLTGKFGPSRIELPMGNVYFEFSHDGSKLYVNDTGTNALYQYDLNADPGPGTPSAARSSAVTATQVLLHTYAAPDFAGDMALAPDGMIYIAGDNSVPPKLHVIGDPDASGTASDLQLDAVELSTGCQLRQGLYHGLRVDDLIGDSFALPQPEILETGVIASVDSGSWITVNLSRTYASMVVVATPQYGNAQVPLVPRIKNASGNTFELTLARLDNSTSPAFASVHYVVVEEGTHNAADHGITMEAVKFTSTVTDRKGSWSGQSRSYINSYNDPVVLGQVMSSNDPRFSVFWSRGSNASNPPSKTSLSVGKHIGEDTTITRAAETIGYIVIESGSGQAGSHTFSAFVGNDSILGMGNAPPYNYAVAGVSVPLAAVASSAAMDVNDGGWPVLYGAAPLTATSVSLAIDEDQLGDSERNHASEQVAVLIVGDAGSGGSGSPIVVDTAAASLRKWQNEYFDATQLAEPSLEPLLWGLGADADNDGRMNLEEYAFGLNPLRWDSGDVLRVWQEPKATGSGWDVRISFKRRTTDRLLNYRLERSKDFLAWEEVDGRQVTVVPVANTGVERVVVADPQQESTDQHAAGAIYYRVRVER